VIAPFLLAALMAQALPPPPPAVPPAVTRVDLDEHLGARLSPELAFTDDRGRGVRLGDYLGHGRPILLTLVYFRCPMLCDLVLQGLVKGLAPLDWRPGREYQGLTVSIDPKDRPGAAALKQNKLLQALRRPDDRAGWPFLVGDAPAIARLADEVGFRYAYDRQSDQYAHPAVAVVLSPDGRISRYLYGVALQPLDVRLALTEAGRGRIGGVMARVLLTCFRYDPATRRYGLLVSAVIKGGGALVLLTVAIVLAILWRYDRRRVRAARAVAPPSDDVAPPAQQEAGS
jgi:protein SCO1/2